MTPAESSVPDDSNDFEDFYRKVEPRIRRALVAACGPNVGIEAAATAMQHGLERWDYPTVPSPCGYATTEAANTRPWYPCLLTSQQTGDCNE
jgi:hypothetical protein